MGLAEALRAGGSEHQADLELQAARTVLERIEVAQTTDPAAHVAGQDGTDEPPGADVSLRREGEYWSVVFEGRTVRLRDLKGMRYLARLVAQPGREFHVLDLVAAENPALRRRRTASRLSYRAGNSAMPARCSTHVPRVRTADASVRSKTTSSRRARWGTPRGPRRPVPNANSSSKSCRALLASVVAIAEPRRRPSVLESP